MEYSQEELEQKFHDWWISEQGFAITCELYPNTTHDEAKSIFLAGALSILEPN